MITRNAIRKRGRPTVQVDAEAVRSLRAEGLSWRETAAELGIGVGTAYRAFHKCQNVIPGAVGNGESPHQ